MGNSFRNILTTLWVGGMWVIGVVAAPILFDSVDKSVAGMLAGKLFHAIGWIGMVAGSYLAMWHIWEEGLRALRSMRFWLIIAMLVCTLVNQFAVFPIIAGIKPAVSNATEGMFGGGLSSWHTISSLIYLIQSLLGLMYVWGKD